MSTTNIVYEFFGQMKLQIIIYESAAIRKGNLSAVVSINIFLFLKTLCYLGKSYCVFNEVTDLLKSVTEVQQFNSCMHILTNVNIKILIRNFNFVFLVNYYNKLFVWLLYCERQILATG